MIRSYTGGLFNKVGEEINDPQGYVEGIAKKLGVAGLKGGGGKGKGRGKGRRMPSMEGSVFQEDGFGEPGFPARLPSQSPLRRSA